MTGVDEFWFGLKVTHGRLQDFFPGVGKLIGVARIFSGAVTFFPQKS